MFERARRIFDTAVPESHGSIPQTLTTLAGAYSLAGRGPEAQDLCLRAIYLSEKYEGFESQQTAGVLAQYAAVLRSCGRDDRADEIMVRVRSIRNRQAGKTAIVPQAK